jgi:hypothetical protein
MDTIPLGCFGNKRNELKFLLPVIEPEIRDKRLSLYVVHVLFHLMNLKNRKYKTHINDVDSLRIQYYKIF